METRTLTGYLGSDLEIRTLPERSELRERTVREEAPPAHLARRYSYYYDQLPVLTEEFEIRIPERSFGKLMLAVHRKVLGGWATEWHRLVIEKPESVAMQNVRLFGQKGNRVQVTGRVRKIRFTDREGQERCLTELVVTHFHLLETAKEREARREEPAAA